MRSYEVEPFLLSLTPSHTLCYLSWVTHSFKHPAGLPTLMVSIYGVIYFMSHLHLVSCNTLDIVILYQSYALFLAEKNVEI